MKTSAELRRAAENVDAPLSDLLARAAAELDQNETVIRHVQRSGLWRMTGDMESWKGVPSGIST